MAATKRGQSTTRFRSARHRSTVNRRESTIPNPSSPRKPPHEKREPVTATTTADSASQEDRPQKYSLPRTRESGSAVLVLESAISAVDPKCHSVLFFQLAEAWELHQHAANKNRMRGATQAKFLNQVARCLEEVSVELTDLPIDRILWVEASSASVWGTFLLEAESRVFELVVSKVTPPDTYDMFAFPFEAADERPAQLQYWIRPKQEKEPDRKSTDPVLVIDDRLQFWRRPTPDSRLRKAVIRMANAMLKEWPRVGLPNVTFLSFPDMPNKLKGSYFVSILARCFLHTSYFGEIIKGHIKSRVADSVALKPLAYLQALHKVFYHVFKPDTPTSEYGRLGTEAYLHASLVFITSPMLRHAKAKFHLGKLVGVGGQGIVHRIVPLGERESHTDLVVKAPVSRELRKHHYRMWHTLLGVPPSNALVVGEQSWLFAPPNTKIDEFTIVMAEANGDLRGYIRPSGYLKRINYDLIKVMIVDLADQVDTLVRAQMHHFDVKPHNVFIYDRSIKKGERYSLKARFMLGDFDLYKDRIVITPYYCHPLVWLWFHKMISNHLYHQYEARYLAPEWWSVAMTTLEAVWPLNLVTEVQHELLEIFDKWSSDIKKRVALPTDIPDAVALLEKYKSRAPNQETIEAEGIWQVIILIFGSESRSDHATVMTRVSQWSALRADR